MQTTLFEFVLKGLFLGLWAAFALRQPPVEPSQTELWQLVLLTLLGLAVGCIASAVELISKGQSPKKGLMSFLVLMFLEGSYWIYIGIVGGLAIALVYFNITKPIPERNWLVYCFAAGAILGFGFHQLRQIQDRLWRFGISALVGVGLVALVILYIDKIGWLESDSARRIVAAFILAGLPFFYILSICGVSEESEVEVAALCAGLGVGIHLLKFPANIPAIGFLLPVLLYFVYVTRWLNGISGFKHTLRGYGYLNTGKVKESLLSFYRARQINPQNALATQGLYDVHSQVDLAQFSSDQETLNLLDYAFCLDRAETLLISNKTPTANEKAEALRMLDLVDRQNTKLLPRTQYLRSLYLAYEKRFDDSSALLKKLLDPGQGQGNGQGQGVVNSKIRSELLFHAWNLGLRLHPELIKRIGEAELAAPGRRMEAIATFEKQLAKQPNDTVAIELKTLAYAGLTESEFLSNIPSDQNKSTSYFNYDYVEQLGLSLCESNEKNRIERGMAFLRIAGRGLPERGPTIFSTLAKAAEKAGDLEAARGYREQVKRAGLIVGAKKLPAEQRELYFSTLKESIADALKRNDFAQAAADQRLMLESGQNELENYRKLADYYEKAGDPLNALLTNETALLYKSADPDLLARKDKYYYSVPVERLQGVKAKVESLFDVNYCVAKGNYVLSMREASADMLDWGNHLSKLALVIQPDLLTAKLAYGRLQLRLGQREKGLSLLEDVREAKASGAEEKEAWYTATKILGELYLNELNRPDLAVLCFTDYKDHPKSGADTLYSIAKAYDLQNDVKNALRFYDAVTAYEQHPRYWEASEAVKRLKNSQ